MSSLILTGLTTITSFSIFGDGWDNVTGLFEDVKNVCCWFRSFLPENRLVRVTCYGFGSLLLLRAAPFILRRYSFFAYYEKQMKYFHRSNHHKDVMGFKQELLKELKEGDHGLPLFKDETLVILELNAGGGTNISYFPDDCYVIGTDDNEESKEIWENNMLLNNEEGTVKANRFIHTIPEALNSVPDNSVSCVISFHSLCSARKADIALNEFHRVLMPGGKVYFIEHTYINKRFTAMWFAQVNFQPSTLLIGCCIKKIEWYIDNAGFSKVSYKQSMISRQGMIGPMTALIPHVYGYLIK